jgi:hypothetical protein
MISGISYILLSMSLKETAFAKLTNFGLAFGSLFINLCLFIIQAQMQTFLDKFYINFALGTHIATTLVLIALGFYNKNIVLVIVNITLFIVLEIFLL